MRAGRRVGAQGGKRRICGMRTLRECSRWIEWVDCWLFGGCRLFSAFGSCFGLSIYSSTAGR
jgi:hypothetical protein